MRNVIVALAFALVSASPVRAAPLPLVAAYRGENLPNNKVWHFESGKGACVPCSAATTRPCAARVCVVHYLSLIEREALLVKWDATRNLYLGTDGQPFDTDVLVRRYSANPGSGGDQLTATRWKIQKPGLWVVDLRGQLYVTVRQAAGKLNHSSLLAGGAALGAGQIRFVKGVITHINNMSGHYRPMDKAYDELIHTRLHVPYNVMTEHCAGTRCAQASLPTPAAQADDETSPYLIIASSKEK